jgi:hypothetical protein
MPLSTRLASLIRSQTSWLHCGLANPIKTVPSTSQSCFFNDISLLQVLIDIVDISIVLSMRGQSRHMEVLMAEQTHLRP